MQVAEIKEIGEEERSHRTNLEERTVVNAHGLTVTYALYNLSPGWEPAGSAMRLRERGTFGVQFYSDGATHGRQFKTEAEARELFDTWTNVR
jgi:hypothetical protein